MTEEEVQARLLENAQLGYNIAKRIYDEWPDHYSAVGLQLAEVVLRKRMNKQLEEVYTALPQFEPAPYVSRLWIKTVGEITLIVYPGQDGKFRYTFSGEREPAPSGPYDVRYDAVKDGCEELASLLKVLGKL